MPTAYNWRTDSARLTTDTFEAFLDPLSSFDDFTVTVSVDQQPAHGAVGVMVAVSTTDSLSFCVGDTTGLTGQIVQPDVVTLPMTLVIQYLDGVVSLWSSVDEVLWVAPTVTTPTIAQPDHAGVFIYTTTAGTTDSATVVEPRLLPDSLITVDGTSFPASTLAVHIGSVPATVPPPLTPSQEAVVHGFVGAMFGDLEYDVGKSVRWTQYFCDDVFITDVGGGEQRYWVINWSASFPEADYGFSSVNYFKNPEGYRKAQWDLAMKAPHMIVEDEDWVLFVDAHEGMSADNRSKPDDYLVSPYASYIYREIARANNASRDRVVIPFFVFTHESEPQNVEYDNDYWAARNTKVQQAAAVPYYLPYQGMTRLIKASVLKDPAFDWGLIDTPVAIPDATVKLQIVSYAYAHWNLQDIVPPQTEVPALAADNDLGWQQRCLLSQVLPITGLPFGDSKDPVGTWQDPSMDVPGTQGPWCLQRYDVTGGTAPDPPAAPPPETAVIRTPLYDLVFRLNLRDGLWYEAGALGNVPLAWDDNVGRWVPKIPPEQWNQTQVAS